MQISIFSLVERPANPSASPDSEKDWLTRVATSPLSIVQSLNAIGPSGWFGRTCPVSCQADKDGTLVPSSGRWQNSGMGSPTESWTLSTCEHADFEGRSPSDGAVYSLSDILETGDVPQRYFLTPRACAGILRRAEKRGKDLPPILLRALRAVAGASSEPEKPEGKTR